MRGLFEYLYRAEGLTLLPHVPPGITRLEQRFPVRFGTKRLYLATVGTGPITGVTLNGKAWKSFDRASISLPYEQTPDIAIIEVAFGLATPRGFQPPVPDHSPQPVPPNDEAWLNVTTTATGSPSVASRPDTDSLLKTAERLRRFHQLLANNRLTETYEAAHARLAIDCLATAHTRLTRLGEGNLKPLADPLSQAAANRLYLDTARKLSDGLSQVLATYAAATDPHQLEIARFWNQTADPNQAPIGVGTRD